MKTVTPPAPKHILPVRPTREQARFAFTILLIVNIFNYADRFILPAILKPLRMEFGLSSFQEGLLTSAFLLVYGITTLPLGIVADRSKRKNVVSICVGIWSIATLFTGITRNFIQMFFTRSILGIGEAGYAPASLSILGDSFPKERRGRVLSYWSSGTLIGTAFGLAIGGLTAQFLGWRWAFYVVGIPSLIAAFLAWKITEPSRGAYDTNETDANKESPAEETGIASAHGSLSKDFWPIAKKILRIPTYWVLLGAFTFSFFTIGGASAWLPTYLVDYFPLTVGQAAIIAAGVLVSSGLLGTLIGGWLADRLQHHRPEGRLMTAMLGFLVGAPLVFTALLIHSLPLFIAVFIVAGMSLSFCTGPLNAVIQDVIVPEVRATALGLALLTAHVLGDAAAPTIIGFISDKTSLPFALIITAPTALFLAGLVCLAGLKTVARDMNHMQEQLQR